MALAFRLPKMVVALITFVLAVILPWSTLGHESTILPFAGTDGEGHPAVTFPFANPTSIAFHPTNGELYIVDGFEVRRVDVEGRMHRFAGTGMSYYNGEDLAPFQTNMSPIDIGFDSNGNFCYSDNSANRVRCLNPDTGRFNTVAGNGDSYPNYYYNGDGGPANVASLGTPSGFVYRNGELFIATGLSDGRIRKVDSQGIMSTFAGGGNSWYSNIPATSASLFGVYDIAFDDSTGDLYFVDQRPMSVLMKITPSGIIHTIGTMYNEYGIYTVSILNGYLYFTNNYPMLKKVNLNNANDISVVVGQYWSGFQDGPVAEALIGSSIFGMAAHSDEHGSSLYFSDYNNDRIRRVDFGTNEVSTVAGNGLSSVSGGFDPNDHIADGSPLNVPYNVAQLGNGDVIIADMKNAMLRKVHDGHISTIVEHVAANPLSGGILLATDNTRGNRVPAHEGGEDVYFAVNGSAVFRYDAHHNQVSFIIGGQGWSNSGNSANGDFLGIGAIGVSTVPGPTPEDPARTYVYIGDNYNGHLGRVDVATGQYEVLYNMGYFANAIYDAYYTGITSGIFPAGAELNHTVTILNGGTYPLSYATNFLRIHADGKAEQVSYWGVTYSIAVIVASTMDMHTGDLYLVNGWYYMLIKARPDGYTTIVAGDGTYGFDGNFGNPLQASFRKPHGIVADRRESGVVYIADTYNQVVRKVVLTTQHHTSNCSMPYYPSHWIDMETAERCIEQSKTGPDNHINEVGYVFMPGSDNGMGMMIPDTLHVAVVGHTAHHEDFVLKVKVFSRSNNHRKVYRDIELMSSCVTFQGDFVSNVVIPLDGMDGQSLSLRVALKHRHVQDYVDCVRDTEVHM